MYDDPPALADVIASKGVDWYVVAQFPHNGNGSAMGPIPDLIDAVVLAEEAKRIEAAEETPMKVWIASGDDLPPELDVDPYQIGAMA